MSTTAWMGSMDHHHQHEHPTMMMDTGASTDNEQLSTEEPGSMAAGIRRTTAEGHDGEQDDGGDGSDEK
jgi:hypothetical protein